MAVVPSPCRARVRHEAKERLDQASSRSAPGSGPCTVMPLAVNNKLSP